LEIFFVQHFDHFAVGISHYLCAMSFQTNIKLGNITNLSDARFAAAAGATYIGFCFDPASPNYIAPIKAKEIIDWVTGSSVVGEFGNQSLEEIRDISELLNVDAIEVNNTLLPDELLSLGKPVIKKINVNQFDVSQLETEIAAYEKVADAFHLYADAATETYDCDQLVRLCESHQIIWGLQLHAKNVLNILASFKPFGINLVGGSEEKAGMKDFDELNELFDLLQPVD
jgi:phosphoribosylanthranilate isomerase